MSGHTPGPWVVCDGNVRAGLAGRFVASVNHYYRQPELRQANARLIAAAPELLESCKRLVGSLGVMIRDPDNDGDIMFARAAIAKATGEAQ